MANLSATFCTKIDVFFDARCSAALRPRGTGEGSLESPRRGLHGGAGGVSIGQRAAEPAGKRCVLGTLLRGALQGRGSKARGRRRLQRVGEGPRHTGTPFVWGGRRTAACDGPSKTGQGSGRPPRSLTEGEGAGRGKLGGEEGRESRWRGRERARGPLGPPAVANCGTKAGFM